MRGGQEHLVSTGTRSQRAIPLGVYFVVLLVLVAAIAVVLAVYASARAERDARASAEQDTASMAAVAAEQLAKDVALIRQTASGLAANPQIGLVMEDPSACSLAFSGSGALQEGHLDLIRPDGSVACSSRGPEAGAGAGYAAESWFAEAAAGPVLVAPVVDAATGRRTIIGAEPIPGGAGVVAAFGDLTPVGAQLVTNYGTGREVEFVVTSADGETVIARSQAPERWVGAPLAGTDFAQAGDETERRDLDGNTRLYGTATVAGTDWRVYAGEDESAALAAADRLRDQQLQIIVGSLVVALLATLVIYRRVALPIKRLGAAVRSSSADAPHRRVPVAGPAEVAALGEDINGLIGAIDRELEERERAEASARVSQRNYRLLFDSSPLPMFICDVETSQILDLNEAAVSQYGYSREELAARTATDLVAVRDRPMFAELLADTKAAEHLGPLHHVTADGHEIEVRITSHVVPFGDDRARFFLVEDVGEREQFERRLRQSQRLESLGQLAGGVAHDFNNLLGVIIGYTSFTKERIETETADSDGRDTAGWEEVGRNVAQIEQAAERAARLTHQLLAFARREVVQPTVADANVLIAEIQPMLERTLGEHVRLTVSLGHDLWPIEIDRGQFEQVLINLAVNARDAMPQGGELTIDTSNLAVDDDYVASRPGISPGRYMRLRVSDTGVGMDEATIQRAFEPFFTTKPVGSGTGLGLATVYGIVTQAGGRAQIYSEPGHGTTFTALLPIAQTAPVPAAAPTAPEQVGGDETILVVEDEDALREVTARMLRRNGYPVLTAANGPQAIELVAQHPGDIHLLVSDVVMPQMLGREVAARVSELQPDIRVLYISGYAQPVLGSQGTLDPGVALLEKPFSEPVLLAKVRQALAAAPVSPPA